MLVVVSVIFALKLNVITVVLYYESLDAITVCLGSQQFFPLSFWLKLELIIVKLKLK